MIHFFFKALPNVIPQLICFPNKFPFKIQQQNKMYKSDFLSFFFVMLLNFPRRRTQTYFYGKLLVGERKVFDFYYFVIHRERFFLFSFSTIGKFFPQQKQQTS